MSTPSKNDIQLVLNGFEEFFLRMVKANSFDLNEFVNFMEPRFKSAGYRDVKDNQVGGGGILIIHDAGAGDFVTQSAAIREIRRLYPDAHITLIVNGPALNLAECCPYIDELLEMRGYYSFFDAFRFTMSISSHLLERRFDICYAFAQYTGTPFLMYMSGARIRIAHANDSTGTGFIEEVPLNYSINLATHLFPTFLYGHHIVDNALSLVDGALFMPTSNRKMEVWYSALDYSIARSHLHDISKPIYALGIGGSRQRKHYPPEKYAQLLEMILNEEPTAAFIILGGGRDDLKSAEIIKNVASTIYKNNVIDLVNKITYRQSAAILKFCDMYIGNDTATMHVAAATDCPVLSPNCFAEDLSEQENDVIPYIYSPYGVPSVIIRPEHALPECKNLEVYDQYGCKADFPHCITQIEPKTLFKGFKLLKKRVAKKINEPLYIH